MLAVLERLYAVALEGNAGAGEFTQRMAWLPELLRTFDQPVPRRNTGSSSTSRA
jgi:hypothetical protein